MPDQRVHERAPAVTTAPAGSASRCGAVSSVSSVSSVSRPAPGLCRGALAVLLVGAWLLPAVAAGQPALSLSDAIRLGLARHPSMEAAEAAVARARAGVRETAASLFPHAQLDGSVTRFQEPMVVAPLHGFNPQDPPDFDRTLMQGSVTLGYTAFDGGARRARGERADALHAASVAGRESVRQAVIAEIVGRYAAVRTTRDLVAAHAARVAALETERARAARLFEQGRAARVVLLRAEAALSGGRAELAGARAEQESSERELARLLGMTPAAIAETAVEPVGTAFEAPDRDAAVAQAMRSNPELSRLAAERAARRASESEARAQWWPRLHAGGRYVHYGSGAGDAGGEWQTGLQLSYPLFTGGARSAALDRTQAETEAAAAELSLGGLRVADAVDRAFGRLEAARARAEAWRTAVEQSAEVARIERLALDTGAGVQTDYLSAEADLLRARAALTEAQYMELLASVELMRALGQLDEDWIARNLEPGS